ncbi:alternate signal-mediated exported protein [Cellulosimicrobium cellulans]|uniref:BspA family leucine-rich repeat surface protein n=1 Tax=Cellulosimicrobium cellulans TaxID=1710 RepID=UPI00195AA754|nr:BspA family leucine-rich repeat surface protein [Cellulosimicrobium cellulans]MBM7818585.1 alternate signal-mediated exported protein [Cellulosimicrobium cellulans]
MNGQARSTSPLRATLLAAAAAVVLLISLPATGAYAAWNDSAPLGTSSVTTGSLGLDQDALPGGTWTRSGSPFDPATDRLTAGTTLTHTVVGVPVTAVGDNLRATFTVAGARVPAAVADHVSVTVSSDPTPVLGADSDADGHQSVALVLTVAADAGLPSGTQTVDLTGLVVTLTNGHGWTDTATLDAGTITTGAAPPAGGTVAFDFDLGLDADRSLCLYLTEPDATINWRDYASGAGEVSVPAVDGRNCHTYAGTGTGQAYVTVTGTFEGLGSPTQTVAEIGALKGVNQWTDAVGTTSAAYAFSNAVNMTYINGAPSTITDFSSAFANASTATSQELSVNGLQTANVTTMAHMFDGAGSINWWSIVSASIPWDTSNVTDMSAMFRNSTIGAHTLRFDTSNVTDMSDLVGSLPGGGRHDGQRRPVQQVDVVDEDHRGAGAQGLGQHGRRVGRTAAARAAGPQHGGWVAKAAKGTASPVPAPGSSTTAVPDDRSGPTSARRTVLLPDPASPRRTTSWPARNHPVTAPSASWWTKVIWPTGASPSPVRRATPGCQPPSRTATGDAADRVC